MNIQALTKKVDDLKDALRIAECELREAWKNEPSNLVRRAYKSDIAITCGICRKPTKNRNDRGWPQHIECMVFEMAGRE